MRRTPTRITAALSALACAAALGVGTSAAEAAPRKKVDATTKASAPVRQAVKVKGIQQHLKALQRIANDNDGNRASGEPGYKASRDYVVSTLRKAGYKPQVQAFTFPTFEETTPTVLSRVAPTPKNYVDGTDYAVMEYSGPGDATGAVVPVDTDLSASTASTSGCEASDFAGFARGSIALIQRGTCDFGTKVSNAATAGASAVIIFNRGVDLPDNPGTGVLNGTLGATSTIPAVGTSYATGVELGAAGTTARVKADTLSEERTTWNVTADTRKGRPGNVVMVGAHLDSVPEGPGINDNGSGTATLLELAQVMSKKQGQVKNKVRFAFWGAEEAGLLGSDHYVSDLAANNPRALRDIAAYLNFDMVGSPNFVRFVYDGDNSTGGGEKGPQGSAQIEKLFTKYFTGQKLRTEPTAFDGRSDYGPFIAAGIPSGGLFTGAEGIKTAREARIYGGQAGKAYDACYHQACDNLGNISNKALNQMSDAVAHSVWTLARSTRSIEGKAKRTSGARVATAAAVGHHGDHLRR